MGGNRRGSRGNVQTARGGQQAKQSRERLWTNAGDEVSADASPRAPVPVHVEVQWCSPVLTTQRLASRHADDAGGGAAAAAAASCPCSPTRSVGVGGGFPVDTMSCSLVCVCKCESSSQMEGLFVGEGAGRLPTCERTGPMRGICSTEYGYTYESSVVNHDHDPFSSFSGASSGCVVRPGSDGGPLRQSGTTCGRAHAAVVGVTG